jgi:uncharacterized integral membrane protein
VGLANQCLGNSAGERSGNGSGGDTAVVHSRDAGSADCSTAGPSFEDVAMNDHPPVRVYAWVKAILFMLIALVFAIFLILNMNAVIEPRVHLVFFRYERPGLLIVLVLTATVAFVAGLSLRAVVTTLREMRAARRGIDAASHSP